MREIKIVPASGGAVALPWAQTMKFTEEASSNELKGDDKIVATVTTLESMSWELEAGGISLEAYAALTGRTLTAAGTGNTETSTMKASGGDSYPYVKLYGRAITDDGDFHVKFYKAKVTSLEGEMKNGEFLVTKCEGTAIDDSTNGICQMVRNKTATALPST